MIGKIYFKDGREEEITGYFPITENNTDLQTENGMYKRVIFQSPESTPTSGLTPLYFRVVNSNGQKALVIADDIILIEIFEEEDV